MEKPKRFADALHSSIESEAGAVPLNEDEAHLPRGGWNVDSSAAPRYIVEIYRAGRIVSRLSVGKTEASIGCGSPSSLVDIPLAGEPQVSRVHAAVRIDDDERLWVTAQGASPTRVAGVRLPQNATIELPRGGVVEICGFELKFRIISQTSTLPQFEFSPRAMAAAAERTFSD